MIKKSEKLPFREGFFKLEIRDEITKEVSYSCIGKNLITFEGADVITKILGRDSTFFPSHIYGEHADPVTSGYIEGSLNGLAAAKTDTIDSVMRAFPRSTSDAEEVIIQNTFATTDNTSYQHNVVNFTSSFANLALNGRIIVGAGIVARPAGVERLVTHAYFPAVIKPVGAEIIITWSIKTI